MDRKSNFIPVIIVLLALVVAGLVALIASADKDGTHSESSSTSTALSGAVDAPSSFETSGKILAKEVSYLAPSVEGTVTWLNPNFVEGGKINEGEILLKLEPHAYQAKVADLKAQVEQVKLEIADENARAYSLVGEHEADDRKKGSSSELVVRMPQRRALKAKLEAVEAQLSLAEEQLKQTSLVAPYDALIAHRFVGTGAYLNSGERACMIQAAEARLVQIEIPLNQLDLLLGAERPLSDLQVKAKFQSGLISYEWTGKIASFEQPSASSDTSFVIEAELLPNTENAGAWKTAPIGLPVQVILSQENTQE